MATSELELRVGARSEAGSGVFGFSYGLIIVSLVAYCLIGAILVATRAPRVIGNMWENTASEGPDVFAAIRTAETGRLYFSYRQSPYIVQSYGPVYYAMNGVIARASHLDVRQVILHSRVICYIAYLLCGVFIFAICRGSGFSFGISALSSLMMLGQPDFLLWNVTVRPDILFLLAMLISLYLAIRAKPQHWSLVALSGFFAAIAFLIKQPGIAAAVAIFGVWVWRKQYKRAIVFAAGAATPLLAALAFLMWHESAFLGQFTAAGKFSWSLPEGIHFAMQLFILNEDGLARILPLCIGILGFVAAQQKEEQQHLIAWFALINWAVVLSGLPQRGAVNNYLLPGWAGCALLLPPAARSIRQLRQRKSLLKTAYLLAGSVFLLSALYLGWRDCTFGYRWSQAPKNMSYSALQPYRIISDVPILSVYGHPDLLDTFATHSLELNGYWSSIPVVQNIRDQKYDLILLMHTSFSRVVSHWRGISDFPPPVVTALNQHYVVLCSTLSSMVLKPRDREIALTPEYFGKFLNFRCGTGLANKSPQLIVSADAR